MIRLCFWYILNSFIVSVAFPYFKCLFLFLTFCLCSKLFHFILFCHIYSLFKTIWSKKFWLYVNQTIRFWAIFTFYVGKETSQLSNCVSVKYVYEESLALTLLQMQHIFVLHLSETFAVVLYLTYSVVTA